MKKSRFYSSQSRTLFKHQGSEKKAKSPCVQMYPLSFTCTVC